MVQSPWIAPDAARFIGEHEARYASLSLDDIDLEVHRLIERHEALVDHECINLYAGTNAMNPRASALLASTIGSRPSLGHPGQKYNKGMMHGEQIEIILSMLLRRLFDARYVETRVPSGSLANLYAYMATCQPGDSILSFSEACAGHPTHHASGAAGLYGLKVHELPMDTARMDIDAVELKRVARLVKPRLIIVAGSMCLFPYDLAPVRAVADELDAWILYDAAHMGGMIAGGAFQDPLKEGADLMTGSTYKSFGGPPSGMVLTNSELLAGRLDAIAFPGLTANFDLSRTAALIIATLDLLEFGQAYARQCIANARALADALAGAGLDVFGLEGRGYTASQHVALAAHRYGGGNRASALAERANLIMTSIGLPLASIPSDANGVRLGTQEVTRWGMREADMTGIARLLGRVLIDGEDPLRVRADTIALRRGFQGLHYIRGDASQYSGAV